MLQGILVVIASWSEYKNSRSLRLHCSPHKTGNGQVKETIYKDGEQEN